MNLEVILNGLPFRNMDGRSWASAASSHCSAVIFSLSFAWRSDLTNILYCPLLEHDGMALKS